MKYSFSIIAALALSATAPVFAQNLNPQVQVTNDYKADMGKAGKISVPLEVPDSLNSFRTSVSYDVFSTPYKGSYEFVPYEISVTPQKPVSDYNKFFLKAGAGYGLRPELKAVWTPVRSGSDHRLTVFQDFHGYAGNYSTVDTRDDYTGYDFSENFGLEGRWFGRDLTVKYGLDYTGIYTDDFDSGMLFHDFTLRGGVRSDTDAKIVYGFDVALSQAFDSMLSQTGIKVQGGFFPNWMLPFELRIDFNLESDFYSAVYDNMFIAQISPKALFEWDIVKLQAGVTMSPASDIQWIYPDVLLTADLFDSTMQGYAFAKGGKTVQSYTDLKLSDHWFNTAYTGSIKPTLERLNVALGLRGSLLKYLQYDIRGGWASYSDAVFASLNPGIGAGMLESGIAYVDYNAAYADIDARWKSPRFEAGLLVNLRQTNVDVNSYWLDLPQLAVDFDAVYNWNSRVFAGVDCKAMTKRDGLFPVDGFVDLGLKGEYHTTGLLGAWARVGNLLNQQVAISPLHIRKGIYFMAGISLNVR